MTERLKEIWSGFEGVTSRHLSGRGVDNIVVPHRQDWQADDAQFLPENYPAPSYAAFEKLKSRLAEKGKKAEKRARRRGETAEMADLAPPPADPAFNGELKPVRDLIRGLMATEARVARSEWDYTDYLSSQPQKKRLFGSARGPGARKKFLGIF
jgi:hypothetical protein